MKLRQALPGGRSQLEKISKNSCGSPMVRRIDDDNELGKEILIKTIVNNFGKDLYL